MVYTVNAVTQKKILVVDDNEIYTQTVQQHLEKDGHIVACCYKGSDALTISKEIAFDFIFTDFRMPEMSGDVVCRLLREQNPSVFIVGFSIENRQRDFLDAGADAFILKEEFFKDLDGILLKGRS